MQAFVQCAICLVSVTLGLWQAQLSALLVPGARKGHNAKDASVTGLERWRTRIKPNSSASPQRLPILPQILSVLTRWGAQHALSRPILAGYANNSYLIRILAVLLMRNGYGRHLMLPCLSAIPKLNGRLRQSL